jgi:hypothetical protein
MIAAWAIRAFTPVFAGLCAPRDFTHPTGALASATMDDKRFRRVLGTPGIALGFEQGELDGSEQA